MRSLQISAPWGFDNIEMVETPDPEPGPSEVRLRMKTVSLNYRDLLIAGGAHVRGPLSEATAIIPFGDGCGIVDAVGENVTRLSAGDRVIPMLLPAWQSGPPTPENLAGALGMNMPGLAREYAVFHESAVVRAPDFLTDAEAACLACAGLTAWSAQFGGPRPAPGDIALLQGTGSVALFALQFAKAAGLETIITSSEDQKLAQARTLGADHTLNYRSDESWATRVRQMTAGRGADFILDMGARGTLEESLRAIRMNGHIAVVGILDPASPLDPKLLLASAAHIRAVTVGSRDMFVDMCRAMSHHRIRPLVGKTFPWTEAREALRELKSRPYLGKLVLEF